LVIFPFGERKTTLGARLQVSDGIFHHKFGPAHLAPDGNRAVGDDYDGRLGPLAVWAHGFREGRRLRRLDSQPPDVAARQASVDVEWRVGAELKPLRVGRPAIGAGWTHDGICDTSSLTMVS
jgi:hypothetical protein